MSSLRLTQPGPRGTVYQFSLGVTLAGMTASVIERERKYEIGPGTVVPRLAGVAGVETQEAPQERMLDATYFDTSGFRLARAGITLRRRTGGTDAGWHVKLPVSADTRQEIQLPLGDSPKVPGRLRKLMRAYTLGEDLVPIARLRTDRFEHRLTDAEGRTLATLTDDHVTGEAGGEAALLDQWRELELELAPDVPSNLLDEFDRALISSGAFTSPWSSKLRRLIGDRVPEPRRQPRKPTAGDIVLTYLAAQVDQLRRADVGVRLDVEDSVHQLRVATRKLRSALRTFESIVDDTGSTVAELKWLAGRLAPARDAEVTEQRLATRLDELPGELVLGPLRQYLTRHFAQEGRARAMDALGGKRYLAVLRSLDTLLEDPPLTKAARKPAKPGLRASVRKSARKLRRAEAATHGLSGAELETALHDVRKKAKRARYAADAVLPVYGKKLRKWRKNVKAVQSVLGDHQDAVVGRAALRQLAITGHSDGQNVFTFGLLYARDAAEADSLRRVFGKRWGKLRKGMRPIWL